MFKVYVSNILSLFIHPLLFPSLCTLSLSHFQKCFDDRANTKRWKAKEQYCLNCHLFSHVLKTKAFWLLWLRLLTKRWIIGFNSCTRRLSLRNSVVPESLSFFFFLAIPLCFSTFSTRAVVNMASFKITLWCHAINYLFLNNLQIDIR